MLERGRKILMMTLVFGIVVESGAQIDPYKRELIQIGYNQPLEGRSPIAAYGFYYLNKPDYFSHSNLTMRLAVAPVYFDAELGVSRLLGRYTDVGIGAAGGGFADSYNEIDQGDYERDESFLGHAAEFSTSIYHRFNPGSRIPLNGVLRGALHYSWFADEDKTAPNFELPESQLFPRVRAGVRWGGREPVMMPALAMELSAWYEGVFRTEPGGYGFNDNFDLEPSSHLFWARALLTYTTPEWKHNFGASLTMGTSIDADRLSAYRLGGTLPFSAEFSLPLPGYYLEELSARSFVTLSGAYNLPLTPRQNWMLNFTAATAVVDYLPGLGQPGNWNSGVGGGLVYRSPTDTWQVAVGYGYGINALRDGERGAQSITILLQFDLDQTRRRFFDPGASLGQSRGLQEIMRTIFR